MQRQEYLERYWRYYCLCENDYSKLLRYVTLNKDNYKTFSDEIARQLQTVGSEFEVAVKAHCCFNDGEHCITEYRETLRKITPDIFKCEVELKRSHPQISVEPFSGWCEMEKAGDLPWWLAYNKVKHNRSTEFKKANLENLTNALAALYVIEMSLVRQIGHKTDSIDVPDSESNIFEIKNWTTKYSVTSGGIYEILNEEIDDMFKKD